MTILLLSVPLLLALLGLFLLAFSLAATVALTVGAARDVNWNRHKPVWLLLRDDSSPALIELFTRVRSDSLRPADARRIVEGILSRQADRSRSWDWRWGNLFQLARERGHLTPAH